MSFTLVTTLITSAFLVIGTTRVHAAPHQIADICESAAAFAARETGVPLDVLRAISLTETGRKIDGRQRPWPWTVNMEGVGKWFDDLAEAQRYVDRHFARGAVSFDVGCFQINYKWHGQAFSSLEEMFDPISNALYAAGFLSDLHAEFGDWSKAAGAYHSRTPKFARRYTARFDRIRANLTDYEPVMVAVAEPVAPPLEEPTSPQRENTFPLLARGGQRNGASLVPLRSSTPPLIDVAVGRPLLDMR